MRKIVFKYGVIAGGLMIAVMLAPFYLQDAEEMTANMRLGEIVGYAVMIVAMGLVFFAVREHRDRNLGGVMPFRTGLLTGLAVTAVAATLVGLATTAGTVWIGPERTHEFMLAYVEYSLGADAPPEAVAAAIKEYEASKALWLNPWFQGFVMFATVVPIGLVMSLVSAAVLRPRHSRSD